MEEPVEDLLLSVGNVLNYSYTEMVANMLLATLLGFVIAGVYRFTHKGLSYSQSFTLTVLFVTVIVAMVMMVIGSSLARAFALVGALSIIRFRTVVKDTKDTAYVFAGLAVGMAAGTSNYFLALCGSVVISLLALGTHYFNYAALYKSEFILRFLCDQRVGSDDYQTLMRRMAKRTHLLHMEPSGDGHWVKMTYDVNLLEDIRPEQLTCALDGLEGISEVVMIAAKSDIDY